MHVKESKRGDKMAKSTKKMKKSLTKTKELYNGDTRNCIVDNYECFS
jgi:hypothetical protein